MLRKLYREFLYVPKYGHMSDKVFRTRISLSALTIALCCIVLCSTTFAWFNDKQSANVSAIQTAEYTLSISCGNDVLNTNNTNRVATYTCTNAGDNTYQFAIEAIGTATNGYCIISANSQTYVISVLKNETVNLTIRADADTVITFNATWETPSDSIERCSQENELNFTTQTTLLTPPSHDASEDATEETTESTEETTGSTEESTTTPTTEASQEPTEDETVTTDATTAPTDAPTTAPSDEPTEDDATDATEESTTEPSEGADDAGEDAPVPSEDPTEDDMTEDATTETKPESTEDETTAPDESTTSDESTDPKDTTVETSDAPQESTADTSEESTVDP